jgi:CHAT domain-containing protein
MTATVRSRDKTRGAGDATTHDAVTLLLMGDAEHAVDELMAAASQLHDAAAYNDLSAALLVRADDSDEVTFAMDALAAADQALAINPRFEPALFNRALALTRIGLLSEARRAWSRYVAVDSSSAWADEALERMHAISLTNKADEWNRQFTSIKQMRPDQRSAAVAELTVRCPEQARLWGESLGIADWADAVAAGDRSLAADRIDLVRTVAKRLRETSGETLLGDVVDVADRSLAHGDEAALAKAVQLYRDGRLAQGVWHFAEAEPKFRAAEKRLNACGSPLAFVARYYTGSALHAQLKLAEAAELLDAMANERLDLRGYRALDATLGWERGACLLERGSISAAMDVFTRSRDALLKLGEIYYPSVFDAYLATALDYAGDESAAWQARRRSFEGLSRAGNRSRLLVVVEAAAAAAMRARKWDRASSLLSISTAEADRQHDALVASDAFTYRAHLNIERGAFDAARLDANTARTWAAQLKDASTRARFEADFEYMEGLSLRTVDPRAAAARFTSALSYFEHADRKTEIPRIYLERALVNDRLGESAAARRDLESGIAVVERERQQIRDLGQRATLIAASDELFAKSIEFAMRDGDGQAAFDFSERHRARALIEMFELGSGPSTADVNPLRVADIRAALAPDAAIVEYAFVADKLMVFVVRRDSFTATSVPIRYDQLMKTMASVSEAARSDATDVTSSLSAADVLLLQPVRAALAGIRHFAICPDQRLSSVPFAALYDSVRGRFLIEDASVTIAPSATLALAASRRAGTGKRPSILSIAGDAFDAERYPLAAPLDHAAGEAKDVASFYAQSRVFTAREATADSVSAALSRYDIVHFAAHGITRKPVADSALIVADSAQRDGELRVRDVVRLDLHRTKVAVLAACRSAAPTTRSDGADNLALAFVAAGVPTAIASLTDLDDDVSAPLMATLHRQLSAGVDPAAAVREVALGEIRDQQGKIRQPMHWASLVVVGGSGDLLASKGRGN